MLFFHRAWCKRLADESGYSKSEVVLFFIKLDSIYPCLLQALALALSGLPVIQLDLHVLGLLRPISVFERLVAFPSQPKVICLS